MLGDLLAAAEAQGFAVDAWVVAGDEIPRGRRAGAGAALKNAVELGVTSVRHCVKVDDTGPRHRGGAQRGQCGPWAWSSAAMPSA